MPSEPQTQPVAITEDEAALYDRQIRLWGIEAQERMRNASILIVNLRGVAHETIKNIVLAGIGTLVCYDPGVVGEEDLGAGFLFREGDVGKKARLLRTDAAKPNIEALNPLVTVKTISDSNEVQGETLKELLTDVNLVCVTDTGREELIRINNACREAKTMFYAGGTYGLMGYIFVDLQTHQHLAPDRSQKVAPDAQPKMIKETINYPSLSDALGSLGTTYKRLSKRGIKDTNPTNLVAVLALWEYQARHAGDQDAATLVSIANEIAKSTGINSQILTPMSKETAEYLLRTAPHEFSPTCAVLGGLLAQDLLKALAGRDPPFANFLTFDGAVGSGNVTPLGMPRKPKKDKDATADEKGNKKDLSPEKLAELGIVAEFEAAADKCRERVKELAAECHRQNRKYRDPEFDLIDDSWLCLHNCGRPEERYDPADVRRVSDIFAYPKFFENGATASDICQGQLGDCWFLSALGTVAAAGQIPRICVERDETAGIYGFVFWRGCAWVEVIIDDLLYTRVPPWETLGAREKSIYKDSKDLYSRTARKGGKNLLFARSATENETWLPLLEKAYAKLYGDYASLEGGWPCDGVEDLTGAIPSCIYTQDILDPERFWRDEVMQVSQGGRMLSCCSPESVLFKYDNPVYEGIVAQHAYSVTKAIEYDYRKFVV
ncbi:hypothetical protein FRB90_005782 [Tulasnella sp. 427]|nr:hypothetical protein FRB90_005782 [Tulasnella sp. 427]